MYRKLTESKIVRITHEVSFHEGTRVIDIMDGLKSVPPESHLVDVENDEESGITKLLFREEQQVV